jgi:hypothetical protein
LIPVTDRSDCGSSPLGDRDRQQFGVTTSKRFSIAGKQYLERKGWSA